MEEKILKLKDKVKNRCTKSISNNSDFNQLNETLEFLLVESAFYLLAEKEKEKK